MNFFYQLALTSIRGVGDVLAKQLLSYCGSAEEVFRTPKPQLLQIPGIGNHLAEAINQKRYGEHLDKEIDFIQKHQIQPLFWTDAQYPARLKQCIDAPVMLFYKGAANLDVSKVVSVVGTRKATVYGKELCERLVEDLKSYDVLVVSGLAYGIDSYAHQAALKHGLATVGVLGHGLDQIYPASNRSLATEMLKHGGLLTEYLSGTKPDRQHFPSRNRIIAGLADVTIVVEAAIKGGALITAEIANTYNRDVCAFPGNVNHLSSMGCNHLIKTHRAHLISGAKDVAYIMNWEKVERIAANIEQPELVLQLSAPEKKIYDAVYEKGQLGIDNLAKVIQISQNQLAVGLLELEMKGILVALPGKIYRIP